MSGRRILIVSCDPGVDELRAVLEQASHEVDQVAEAEAYGLLQTQPCDVLLLDSSLAQSLPALDCRRLRAAQDGAYLYVIMVCDSATPAEQIVLLQAGADEVIRRPVSPMVLSARLDAIFRFLDVERDLRARSQLDALTGVMNRQTLMSTIATGAT